MSAVKENKKSGVNLFVDLLNGNILTREKVIGHLPYLLFLALLALVYISNGFLAEENIRTLNKIGNETKELRSEYITIKSELMYRSKQSEVVKIITEKGLGLKESFVPPKKLIKESKK